MINCFDGEFAFLSNFYESPIKYNGTVTMPTVEHYFQAAKAAEPLDFLKIAAADTPGKAKRLGRKCKLRADWEEKKIDVMRQALKLKFADPTLKAKLIATGDEELVEGTTWHDRFWGVCNCEKCQGHGENHLGRLLMELRNEYMEENENEVH